MINNLTSNTSLVNAKIAMYVSDSIDFYFNHPCYKSLERKKAKLNNSIDMKFSSNRGNRRRNAWQSNIAIPMVRESFLARRAITSNAFSTSPLVTVNPDGVTSAQTAVNMNNLLQSVVRATNYQQRTLAPVIDSCSRWGAAVTFSYFQASNKLVKRTVPIYSGTHVIGYEKAEVKARDTGVFADSINVLNYFQQPDEPTAKKSRFRGFVERVPMYQVKNDAEATPDVYIQSNVKKVLDMAKQGGLDNSRYSTPAQNGSSNNSRCRTTHNSDSSHHTNIDRYRWWGKLSIPGNEDDDTTYYIEMVNDLIVRIQENPHDEDIIPLDIWTFDPRPEYWWGTTDAENVIPMENYLQMIFSSYSDSVIQELQRMIFYDKSSGINTTTINEGLKNGGFIGFDKKHNQDIDKIFYQYQFPGAATGNLNYIAGEIKQAAGRVRPKADFSQQPNQGGLKNKTATAANIMGTQANTQESFHLRQFGYGLMGNMKTMMTLLKQRSGNILIVRPTLSGDPITMYKEAILGDFNPIMQTTLTENEQVAANRIFNVITGIQNFRGTGDPAWMNVNMQGIIKDWLKSAMPNSDIDAYYPEQNQMQQMQQFPQQGVGAQPPQQQGVAV